MTRGRIHPIGCRCGCQPRSPADPDNSARSRVIIAAIALVAIIACVVIIHWRAS